MPPPRHHPPTIGTDSDGIMPRNELTARLEPARRQFFQWHFVEERQIVEVKEKMDQLTRDLKIAGYAFDFVAE